MACVPSGLEFRTPARLDPDFVGLCHEMQRLPLDIAKKQKLMSYSTIFRHIMERIYRNFSINRSSFQVYSLTVQILTSTKIKN